jgi:hypothetical protein
MFTHDRGATASYRTLARGFGCRWARTYRVLQQDDAGQRDPQRRDLDRPWRLSSTNEATGKRVDEAHV